MALKNSVISRVLTSLNNSTQQIKDNALYQAVKALIGISKEINDEVNENIASITNIVNTITPSNSVEDLDGSNDPGVSNSYSRGDHKHDYGVNSIDYDRIQQISAAARLLGRRSGSAGNVEEIDLDPTTLEIIGTTLFAIVPPAEPDYVVLSDGVVASPTPINDGAGNFIYIPYVP